MKTQSKKIVLIGAGNVATQLGLSLKRSKHTILQVYSKHNTSAITLAKKLNCESTDLPKKINPDADIYIIAIKDDAIIQIVKQLKVKNKIIVHTSGSSDMNVLETLSKNYGVFYPLQTFSKNTKVKFKNIPICIEASNKETLNVLQTLSKSISNNVQEINSKQRKAIHLAAVFACNFSNHLYSIADQILAENKLSFDLLKPLIRETAGKIKINSPTKIQTGPAIRGDKKIMDAQLKILSGKKDYQQLYKLFSKSIIASNKK